MPLDQDECVFDAKLIQIRGNTSEVIACVCPKVHVQQLLDLGRDSGIDPELISVEGFAYANILENWDEPPVDVAERSFIPNDDDEAGLPQEIEARALLHIGHQRTVLSLYHNNVLLAARTIFWGGKDIAEGIAKTFNVQFTDAIKVLQTKGFVLTTTQGASQDQIVFSQAIKKQLDELIKQIRLTLMGRSSELKLRVTQLHLTGGVARLQNISAYLTQTLEIPCNLLQHRERYDSHLDTFLTVGCEVLVLFF